MTTDGTGILEYVSLPYLRQVPVPTEITSYVEGTYNYVDRPNNRTRLLQASNETSISNNDWEMDT